MKIVSFISLFLWIIFLLITWSTCKFPEWNIVALHPTWPSYLSTLDAVMWIIQNNESGHLHSEFCPLKLWAENLAKATVNQRVRPVNWRCVDVCVCARVCACLCVCVYIRGNLWVLSLLIKPNFNELSLCITFISTFTQSISTVYSSNSMETIMWWLDWKGAVCLFVCVCMCVCAWSCGFVCAWAFCIVCIYLCTCTCLHTYLNAYMYMNE